MRLTQWTDYTLRVLMYCAATEGREQPVTITEVAEGYGISRSHLMKIVQQLSAQGLLETTRGRGGGMRLMRPASDINIGAVVRAYSAREVMELYALREVLEVHAASLMPLPVPPARLAALKHQWRRAGGVGDAAGSAWMLR